MKSRQSHIASFVFFLVLSGLTHAGEFGEFIGTVEAVRLGDGRSMKLTKPFAYLSPDGARWEAPAGSIVNGASIPPFAWSFIGNPLEGKYRNASVIHDVACVSQSRPWQTAHEAFYTAMLAADVDGLKAKVMYAAVYHFGRRWQSRFELINIPLAEADGKTKSIFAGSDANDKRVVKVRPRVPYGEGGAGDNAQPPTADVTITFIPPLTQITQEDFGVLRKKIEAEDMPLDAIRNYRAAARKK